MACFMLYLAHLHLLKLLWQLASSSTPVRVPSIISVMVVCSAWAVPLLAALQLARLLSPLLLCIVPSRPDAGLAHRAAQHLPGRPCRLVQHHARVRRLGSLQLRRAPPMRVRWLSS